MKRLLFVLLAIAAMPAAAALKVFATVPEWGALAQEIGGDQVQVFTATTALQDPHHIDARPSLIARARSADLLLATGAELEIGWLPAVQRESGNSRIQSGQAGYFEAARYVTMLDIPARLDRADGDVHAAGNPHIQTDPRNFLKIGQALAQRMKEIDPANAAGYDSRWRGFSERWRASLLRWEKAAAPLRGVPVITQHKAWTYLFDWLGLREVGTLEPKPGVEPAVAHLAQVREQAANSNPRMVIRAAYNSARPAEWLSAEAKLPIVVLPFSVGGTPEAKDLATLFDDTVARLLRALK
ncbi:MAG: zinc ABC transporter substrate-binding protein [Sulfuritalea sp.]|jgi:zinc/manganese transport system substrate-binding protein|nr:zinc ABC transporter substrate-binding protein [Sulfuritalea sp.]MDP1982254.1 zinc ABC transporter substrate-binding protein [Sulfuritalea sp.]